MKSLSDRPTRRRAIATLFAFGVSGGSSLPGNVAAQTAKKDVAPTSQPKARAEAKDAPWLSLPPTPKLPQTARSGLAAVNGTRIYYAQFGDGPPVLLLHGGLANSDYWGHQIEELARSFLVTVMDTRGHGRSPVTSHAYSYKLFAQDVVGLLDFLKIPKIAIVGWSDGAITGLQLAMTQPDRVSRLFAFGANSTTAGLKPNGSRSSVFVVYEARCKTEYSRLSPHPEKWPQLVGGLSVMWRSEPNFTTQKLATIGAPTAISDGEYDEIIKREDTQRMSLAIPGARLLIQPAVSHFAMLQNAAQFNTTMVNFLAARG